ncbi:nucleotidyltransferase family protein [Cohnella panacarvi]|uniref:nucleotidyltransferase family protein n=1 Tax=Cohnella panacarvi TaxID=400776 RepID=UPI0004795C26|nr:nucleotidyltransferase domain-containing protein [Cohnella panacarvi]
MGDYGNVTVRNNILRQTKDLVLHHLTGKPAKAYLFGSWARSEEKKTSDIDIAIEFETDDESNHVTLATLRNAAHESTIPYKMDIVYLNKADEYIIDKVRKEGVLWEDQRNESS